MKTVEHTHRKKRIGKKQTNNLNMEKKKNIEKWKTGIHKEE